MGSNTSLIKKKVFANLGNIKSDIILKKVFNYINQTAKLKLIKKNKKFQNKLNINIQNYKEYYDIIIEIIPYEKNLINLLILLIKKMKNITIYILMILMKKLKDII